MTPADAMMNTAKWRKVEGEVVDAGDGLPYVTHTGILRVGELSLDVVQLSTGQRVITEQGMQTFLAWLHGASLKCIHCDPSYQPTGPDGWCDCQCHNDGTF